MQLVLRQQADIKTTHLGFYKGNRQTTTRHQLLAGILVQGSKSTVPIIYWCKNGV